MTESSKTCPQCGTEVPPESASALCPKCLLQVGFETQSESAKEASAYTPTFIAPTVEELTPHFPQLEILEEIGHGGMGVVYKARQTELDRIVALKIIRPGISEDQNFSERFQREARALAKLNHPNIITVFDFGRKDGLFFFIMEYVDGTNLRHLERTGELSPQEALKIVPQVCAALQYAHDNGVVHRDIKPENILLNKEGEVRIADFGLAKLAGVTDDAPLTGTWQVMGTPHYMAPEQFEKPTTVDHRADIYSLGVVIYELLTGELPLGRFPLPSSKARIDVRLDEVVLRSLDKEPDRRYQSVTDVATAVDEASSPPGGSSRTAQAANWVRDKTGSLGGHAATLKQKAGEWKDAARAKDWRTTARGALDWLASKKTAVAICLIVAGVIDIAMAILPGPRSPGLSPDSRAFFAFMTFIAGIVAIYLGRKLRQPDQGPNLWLVAVFCMLPWHVILPFSVFRMVFAAWALFILRRGTTLATGERDTDTPHLGDRLMALATSIWRIVSIRICLFTVFGIVTWCGVCLATVVAVIELSETSGPAVYYVNDRTGSEVSPVSAAYRGLHIASSQRGETQRRRNRRVALARNQIDLTIQPERSEPHTLRVDFSSNQCELISRSGTIAERLPIDRDTVVEWMTRSGVDTSTEAAQLEMVNLLEIVRLMQRTRGIGDRLNYQDADRFPSLSNAIIDLLQDERAMRHNLIPVGRLLNPEFFVRSSDTLKISESISLHSSVIPSIIGIAITIWVVGLLRVVRVLYKHLWKSTPGTTAGIVAESRANAIARWRRCSLALFVAGVVAAVFAGYVGAVLNKWDGMSGLFADLPFELPVNLQEPILMAFVAFGIMIALCGLIARPILRGIGWWLGFCGGALAMAVTPLSLITFPTGLAAWIVLTDADCRNCFRRSSPDAATNVADADAVTAIADPASRP